ncbi:redoxin domain-containing protein [Rubrivirga sp.]|uniref:redoxin domain-containing protein n=1 Tax=Rubrivirga sp. TaxID=1885344 RepID=UPI003B5293FB
MTRLLLFSALLAVGASAQGLTYGDPVPLAAESFATADGAQSTLATAGGPAGLVVVFWSNACPWTDRYTPRLADLATRYTPAGIGFVLVNANDPAVSERETLAASREMATTAGLVMPYLADPDGRLAAAFGATNAPHAFFFDGTGALRYDGTLDDSPASADRVRVPYLAQAMDQSVAGLPIEVQRTQAFGCTLKRAVE